MVERYACDVPLHFLDSLLISLYYVADNVTKVIPARCPSHNAFKCTGECGFDGCNTHFMEQDALQEHINRGREKKISLTSSCAQVSRTQCLVLYYYYYYFILIYKMYSSPNSIYQFNHCSLFIFTGVFFPKVNQTRRRSTQIFFLNQPSRNTI